MHGIKNVPPSLLPSLTDRDRCSRSNFKRYYYGIVQGGKSELLGMHRTRVRTGKPGFDSPGFGVPGFDLSRVRSLM
jgi:hypothetical protein